MKLLITALVVFYTAHVHATDGEWAVSRIPSKLTTRANSVLRLEHQEFIIKNPGEAIYRQHVVLTVLNANADRYAQLSHPYDKRVEIRSFEGNLYDHNGFLIKSLKKKDIKDEYGASSSLVEDTRYKAHSFFHRSYPYTVEYEIEVKYNGMLFYPDWHPQPYSMMAVENSSFSLFCPDDYTFRFKGYQGAPEPTVTPAGGGKRWNWTISQMPSVVHEVYAASLRKLTPLVLFGPTEFEIHGYEGNMSDWNGFANFTFSLNKGRDVLPDNIKQEVQRLTAGITDAREKVNILYRYMQDNMRYISIQLGIGGWQTLDAAFVAAKKYGDCKALSNYMYALLKQAGIRSLYTKVRAGKDVDDIRPDFPSQQFNHVILCVPLPADTVWLECTDPYGAPGYMGSFTGNRHVLVTDENGGKLVRTPAYGVSDNMRLRKTEATVDASGNVNIRLNSLYKGLRQDDLHLFVNHTQRDKIKEALQESFDFATYDITSFNYREIKARIPAMEESIEMNVANYATVTGKRLFLVPNLISKSGRKLSADSTRKYPLEMGNASRDIDTVVFQIPEGYTKESLPADVNVSGKFGKYTSSIKISGTTITYYRMLEMAGGNFPASDYAELVAFLETVYKADRNRIVFVKPQ